MSWTLDGALDALPSAWDFSHVDADAFSLPQVRTAQWGGFVFICMDPQTEPLEAYLELLPEHFKFWPLEDRFKAVHVAKVVDCNWKVAVEAFLEGYHIPATHTQTMTYFNDECSQYDVWPGVRHVSRVISTVGTPSPHLSSPVDDDRIVEAFQRDVATSRNEAVRAPGQSPRAFLAQSVRTNLSQSSRLDLDHVSDSEMLDTIQYFVFPNFSPWAGVGAPIVYRWRPYGNDTQRSILEVMLLFVVAPDRRPKRGAPIHWLAGDERFSDAAELGELGPVLDQDLDNFAWIQKGLRGTRKPGVTLAHYQESRIRRFNRTLDEYLAD
jgi:hypothetical protein